MKLTYRSTRIACYAGYVAQAITVNLPPLLFVIFRDQFGVTYEELGRLVLLNFVTQLTVDFLSGWFCDRLGMRCAAVLAHVFCTAGLVSLSILPRIFHKRALCGADGLQHRLCDGFGFSGGHHQPDGRVSAQRGEVRLHEHPALLLLLGAGGRRAAVHTLPAGLRERLLVYAAAPLGCPAAL